MRESMDKYEEVRILEIMDTLPLFYDKIGVKKAKAVQDHYLNEMEMATENCDGAMLAISTSYMEKQRAILMSLEKKVDVLNDDEYEEFRQDLLKTTKREANIYHKWNDVCICTRKDILKEGD